MKGKVLLLALSAVALATSCTNDEVTEISDSQAIKFDVNAGGMTRASEAFCNNKLPEAFNVWADTDSKVFLNGNTVEQKNNSIQYEFPNGETHYWPANAVNFYAIVNNNGSTDGASAGTTTFSAGNAPVIANYKVADNAANQADLIYAVKKGLSKPTATNGSFTNTPVSLNFRHALAQMVFRAKNKSKGLHVVVKSVTVAHFQNQGTFTLPNSDTEPNYQNHTGTATGTEPTSTTQGSWTALTGDKNYTMNLGTATTANETTTYAGINVPLTTTTTPYIWLTGGGESQDADYSEQLANTLMLIPQTSAIAWDGTTAGEEANDHIPAGACFVLDVEIYNVADPEGIFDATKDVAIHVGKLAVPITSTTWEQGKRYIYSFVFGNEGEGGKDPEDPDKPVFVSIKYEVTVDDFVPVVKDDIEIPTVATESESSES